MVQIPWASGSHVGGFGLYVYVSVNHSQCLGTQRPTNHGSDFMHLMTQQGTIGKEGAELKIPWQVMGSLEGLRAHERLSESAHSPL